jgi:hypothetical protein
LSFASQLWGLFKALIAGALNDMANLTSVETYDVLSRINQTVVDFFTQVMQMDHLTLRQEALARSTRMKEYSSLWVKFEPLNLSYKVLNNI